MKKKYIEPEIVVCSINMEQAALVTFSQVDNDGDGKTDQQPILEGDPEGGIGAKPGFVDEEEGSGWGTSWY